MKLTGSIEVSSRLLPSANIPGRRKPQRGCLSIARQSVKNNDLYLLLQTTQNKQGTKYKVDKNIDKVFTKFVNDGKATIRLKEPPHDLIIQCDTVQLKSFLHVLKLGLSKQIDPSVLSVSNLNPKSLSNLALKTKVVVKNKSEYPVLAGFPRTVESLYLAGLERKSFDRQILRLQSLRVLDLSCNLLTSLPNELGTLPSLTELYLASNRLGTLEPSKWSWMNGPTICRTLRLLDISKNDLKALPCQIRKLGSLVTLKVRDNSLTKLPQNIGGLMALEYLELQKNLLLWLPGCMKNLRLVSLDVSDNPLDAPCDGLMRPPDVLRLIDIASRVIINSGTYYDASTIPITLVKYLDEVTFCVCGKSCFGTFIRRRILFSLASIANSVKSSGNSYAPFECNFCSMQCSDRHSHH